VRSSGVRILFLGRDGSPSRPLAGRYADINRGNGGLGEPALPEASGRADHPWSAAVERGRSTLPKANKSSRVPGLGYRVSGTGFRVWVRDMKCKGANAEMPRAKVQKWEANKRA
jgi:hypothetical protein